MELSVHNQHVTAGFFLTFLAFLCAFNVRESQAANAITFSDDEKKAEGWCEYKIFTGTQKENDIKNALLWLQKNIEKFRQNLDEMKRGDSMLIKDINVFPKEGLYKDKAANTLLDMVGSTPVDDLKRKLLYGKEAMKAFAFLFHRVLDVSPMGMARQQFSFKSVIDKTKKDVEHASKEIGEALEKIGWLNEAKKLIAGIFSLAPSEVSREQPSDFDRTVAGWCDYFFLTNFIKKDDKKKILVWLAHMTANGVAEMTGLGTRGVVSYEPSFNPVSKDPLYQTYKGQIKGALKFIFYEAISSSVARTLASVVTPGARAEKIKESLNKRYVELLDAIETIARGAVKENNLEKTLQWPQETEAVKKTSEKVLRDQQRWMSLSIVGPTWRRR